MRKQKEREIQRKLEAKMALEVQRYFRGVRGRRRYKFILHYKIECDAATMLQRAYRGRRGRRMAEARRRYLTNQLVIAEARQNQARLLRPVLLTQRKTQRYLLKRLEKYGFDPISYMNTAGENTAQVMEDYGIIKRYVAREGRAFIHAPFDGYARDKMRRDLKSKDILIKDVGPGEVTKIVASGEYDTGLTGYVLSIDRSQLGNPIAEVRLDRDGKMAFHPLMTPATPYEPAKTSLYRIPSLAVEPLPLLTKGQRSHLKAWGEMEAPRWEAFLAARTIQRNFRCRRSKHIAARKRYNYWSSVRDKRNLFLQTLGTLSAAKTASAQRIVRAGVGFGELAKDGFEDLSHQHEVSRSAPNR